MRVVICGAGIAGTCAAVALQQHDIEALVVEQRDAHGEAGAGIQLAPNATRLLFALGLEPELLARCRAPEAIEIRDGVADRLGYRIPLGTSLQRRYGAPYLITHRGDLLAALRQKLQSRDSLLLNREVVGVVQSANGAAAQCSDGSVTEGDFLIGADGAHSLVRRQLFPRGSGPSRREHIVWRLQIENSKNETFAPGERVLVWCGDDRHVVVYALPGTHLRSRQVNIVAITEQGAVGQGNPPGEEVAIAFADWRPIGIRLEKLIHHPWKKWFLPQGDVLSQWSQGRIGLLGDACHPIPPFLAQGAGMAVEDAFSLVRSLRRGQGLKELDCPRRLARMRRVLRATEFQRRLFHRRGLSGRMAWQPLAQFLGRCFPETLRDLRLGWLYGNAAHREDP